MPQRPESAKSVVVDTHFVVVVLLLLQPSNASIDDFVLLRDFGRVPVATASYAVVRCVFEPDHHAQSDALPSDNGRAVLPWHASLPF